MADAEDIQIQYELLGTYRRKLKHHLKQHAALGALAPFSLEEEMQDAYLQIARIKQILRSWDVPVNDDPDDSPAQTAQGTATVAALNIDAILASRRARLLSDGWREGEAYMDTLIVPLPHGTPRINRSELRSFVRGNTIQLRSFGGPRFPHEQYSHTAQMRNLPDGCELVDTGSWPYHDWFFRAWSFSIDGTLFSRAALFEDHEIDKKYTVKFLRYIWVLQDIVRPLLFSRALLSQVQAIDTIKLHLYWGGMEQRYLVNGGGFGIVDAAMCHQPEIALSETIAIQTDYQAVARSFAEQVIWLCNWTHFSQEALDRDIATMLRGEFPG